MACDKQDPLKLHEFKLNCGFHGNQGNSGLVVYLKMFVLVTPIGMPNFMLVSKTAQFTRNFELCRRTIKALGCNFESVAV